jgi:hypothetical protein
MIFLIFKQTVGFPKGTNCPPLFADLSLYSYEGEFIENFYMRRINLLLWLSIQHLHTPTIFFKSINSDQFYSYIDSILLEIKDTTESSTLKASASYLDVLLNIDAGGKLTTQLYDKRDDFSFTIVNFPFICSNTPAITCIWHIYIYILTDLICKDLLYIRSVFESG